jgi:hypothetical protein
MLILNVASRSVNYVNEAIFHPSGNSSHAERENVTFGTWLLPTDGIVYNTQTGCVSL